MKKQKLYAGLVTVRRDAAGLHQMNAFEYVGLAWDRLEFEAKVDEAAAQAFPPEDGWRLCGKRVYRQIPNDIILDAAKYIRLDERDAEADRWEFAVEGEGTTYEE